MKNNLFEYRSSSSASEDRSRKRSKKRFVDWFTELNNAIERTLFADDDDFSYVDYRDELTCRRHSVYRGCYDRRYNM